MDLTKITGKLLEHLSDISDEQFEKELIEAGINNCEDIAEDSDVNIQYEVKVSKSVWGKSLYLNRKQGFGVEFKEVA